MQRPACTPGLNWVTLFLTVQDANKALEFYTTIFGFTINAVLKDKKGRVQFARITHHNTHIVMQPTFADETVKGSLSPSMAGIISPIIIWMYTEHLDDIYQRAIDHKLKILAPIQEKWWGDKAFRVVDPDGYVWDIARNEKDFDPTLIPAHFDI